MSNPVLDAMKSICIECLREGLGSSSSVPGRLSKEEGDKIQPWGSFICLENQLALLMEISSVSWSHILTLLNRETVMFSTCRSACRS